MYDFYFENKRHDVVVNRNVWKRFAQDSRMRNQRTSVLCNRAEDTSAYEYRETEDTSRRNGNQLGAASYDWDLTYWQATLARPPPRSAWFIPEAHCFWFPWGANPWETILLPTMTPWLSRHFISIAWLSRLLLVATCRRYQTIAIAFP